MILDTDVNTTDGKEYKRVHVVCVSPCRHISGEGDAVVDECERSGASDVFPLCRGRTTWKMNRKSLIHFSSSYILLTSFFLVKLR